MVTVLRSTDPFGRGPGPAPADFAHVGQYLAAVRDHRGLSLAQVAAETRVRRLYLSALEEGEHAPLPSRPFAVGYVRAYARALGLDGDEIVAQFRADFPEDRSPLRAPIGVSHEKDQVRRLIYWAGGAVVCAVVLWNVAQRTIINDQPAPGPAFPAAAQQSPLPSPGPVKLGAPKPPPADQTVPQPYVTPGLPQTDPAANDPGAVSGSAPVAVAAAVQAPTPSADPPQFESHGAVYGAAAKDGDVIIQAKARAALIVRSPTGTIYFARQLAVGEAYRVPRGTHATADVSDPAAFDVYVGGKFQSLLTEPLTPLDIAVPAPAPTAAQAPVAAPANTPPPNGSPTLKASTPQRPAA
jgi:transcriptional regulator with XRE-family HTH domain